MGVGLNLLRLFILGYFAALFALALWVGWRVLAAAAANPDCTEQACRRYEQVGNWTAALDGDVLLAASMSFTGVVFAGMVVFALPWWLYLQILKRRGVIK